MMKRIPNDLFFSWVESEITHGRSVQFRVKGNSMFPLLRSGKDEVVLFPCSEEELCPMDVVLFRYKGKHVLHRILHRYGSRLLIQGDGSFIAKEECTTKDVIGKVNIIIRPSGKTLSVYDNEWRLNSLLWQKTGVIRTLLLRILKKII